MAAYGIPHEDIAKVIGCSHVTMRKHFREELDRAAIEANARVAESLYRAAINGNITAAIFWAKTRMRWREVTTTDVNFNTRGENGTQGATVVVMPVPAKANPQQPDWVPTGVSLG